MDMSRGKDLQFRNAWVRGSNPLCPPQWTIFAFHITPFIPGRAPLAEVSKCFIPIWFCLSALNPFLGVKQAGYSIGEELPIFLLIFTIPAGAAAFLWWRSVG
jgi:hypothetical protein